MVRDMTTGSSAKKLILFSIPLLIGQVFQQFYNMVDSIVVGQYVGKEAFAAVGSTGSITFFVLGLVFGACSGFAIPVAQDFGAGDVKGVRRCVANIIYIGTAFAAVMTLVTAPLTTQILELMGTKPELMEDAYDYLFWIFVGLAAQMMYNLLAGILRSLGDSRTPLVFLILSSLLNVALDILFVRNFGMGVKGASIATVLAQLVSGVCCLVYIAKKYPILHPTCEDMRPDGATIRRLLEIGLPMGLQFSVTAIGSIILQWAVNGLDLNVIASVSAAGKVQNLVVSPMDAFGVTVATYAGQNYGAGEIGRVRRGIRQVYLILLACSVVGLLINATVSDKIALLFIDASETEVIAQVRRILICNGHFYPALAAVYVLRNALQGVGFSKAAMLAGLFELVARSAMGLLVVPALGFTAVCFSDCAAWGMATLILIPLYIVLMRKLDARVNVQPRGYAERVIRQC